MPCTCGCAGCECEGNCLYSAECLCLCIRCHSARDKPAISGTISSPLQEAKNVTKPVTVPENASKYDVSTSSLKDQNLTSQISGKSSQGESSTICDSLKKFPTTSHLEEKTAAPRSSVLPIDTSSEKMDENVLRSHSSASSPSPSKIPPQKDSNVDPSTVVSSPIQASRETIHQSSSKVPRKHLFQTDPSEARSSLWEPSDALHQSSRKVPRKKSYRESKSVSIETESSGKTLRSSSSVSSAMKDVQANRSISSHEAGTSIATEKLNYPLFQNEPSLIIPTQDDTSDKIQHQTSCKESSQEPLQVDPSTSMSPRKRAFGTSSSSSTTASIDLELVSSRKISPGDELLHSKESTEGVLLDSSMNSPNQSTNSSSGSDGSIEKSANSGPCDLTKDLPSNNTQDLSCATITAHSTSNIMTTSTVTLESPISTTSSNVLPRSTSVVNDKDSPLVSLSRNNTSSLPISVLNFYSPMNVQNRPCSILVEKRTVPVPIRLRTPIAPPLHLRSVTPQPVLLMSSASRPAKPPASEDDDSNFSETNLGLTPSPSFGSSSVPEDDSFSSVPDLVPLSPTSFSYGFPKPPLDNPKNFEYQMMCMNQIRNSSVSAVQDASSSVPEDEDSCSSVPDLVPLNSTSFLAGCPKPPLDNPLSFEYQKLDMDQIRNSSSVSAVQDVSPTIPGNEDSCSSMPDLEPIPTPSQYSKPLLHQSEDSKMLISQSQKDMSVQRTWSSETDKEDSCSSHPDLEPIPIPDQCSKPSLHQFEDASRLTRQVISGSSRLHSEDDRQPQQQTPKPFVLPLQSLLEKVHSMTGINSFGTTKQLQSRPQEEIPQSVRSHSEDLSQMPIHEIPDAADSFIINVELKINPCQPHSLEGSRLSVSNLWVEPGPSHCQSENTSQISTTSSQEVRSSQLQQQERPFPSDSIIISLHYEIGSTNSPSDVLQISLSHIQMQQNPLQSFQANSQMAPLNVESNAGALQNRPRVKPRDTLPVVQVKLDVLESDVQEQPPASTYIAQAEQESSRSQHEGFHVSEFLGSGEKDSLQVQDQEALAANSEFQLKTRLEPDCLQSLEKEPFISETDELGKPDAS